MSLSPTKKEVILFQPNPTVT